MSTKTGTAPSRAQPRTMAAPMPFPPPVTRTTLSLSCKSTFRRFQLIEFRRVAAEDSVLDVRREILNVVFDDLEHLLITGGEQAHRPIGAEHQALRAKRTEYYIQVRPKVFFLPILPVGFGDEAGKFAIDVGLCGDVLHEDSPARAAAGFDFGFGDVVDDEFLFGKMGDEFEGRVNWSG